MKAMIWLWLGVGLLLGGAATAGQEDGAAGAAPQPRIKGYDGLSRADYDRLMNGAAVGERERQQVLAILEEKERGLLSFDTVNIAKARELGGTIEAQKDQPAGKQARQELGKLLRERAELAKSYDGRALAMLPESAGNRLKTEALWKSVAPRLAKAQMTTTQVEQAQEICEEILRVNVSSPYQTKTPADRAMTEIVSRVLSREQRNWLAGVKTEEPVKAKKTPAKKSGTKAFGKDSGEKGSDFGTDSGKAFGK